MTGSSIVVRMAGKPRFSVEIINTMPKSEFWLVRKKRKWIFRRQLENLAKLENSLSHVNVICMYVCIFICVYVKCVCVCVYFLSMFKTMGFGVSDISN